MASQAAVPQLPQRARRKRRREASQPDPVAAATPAKELTWPHVTEQQYEWGSDLAQALEQVTLAMFGYMTELGTVEPDPALDWEVTATGKDVLGLVFHLLDEALFRFATDDLIACDVQVTRLVMPGSISGACSGDAAGQYSVTLACRGERFSLAKHPQGTEVKAITYSNMQVHGLGGGDKQVDEGASSEGVHVYVIVDI